MYKMDTVCSSMFYDFASYLVDGDRDIIPWSPKVHLWRFCRKRHRKLEKIPWNSGQTSWKWQCLASSGRVQKFHTVKWTVVNLQDFKRNIQPPSSKQTIANLSPTPPFAGAATGAEEAWLWSATRKEASPSWSTNERNCLTLVTLFWHPQSAQLVTPSFTCCCLSECSAVSAGILIRVSGVQSQPCPQTRLHVCTCQDGLLHSSLTNVTKLNWRQFVAILYIIYIYIYHNIEFSTHA